MALPKMAKIEITGARGNAWMYVGGKHVGRVLDLDMSGGYEVRLTLIARGPDISFVEKRSEPPVEPGEFGLSCAHLADDHLVFAGESIDEKIAKAAREVLEAVRRGLPDWNRAFAYERG